MSCYYPQPAWYSADLNPDTGKRSILFTPRGSNSETLEVPCGKCTGCRADQSLMWSIRSYHESTLYDRNAFVTLTYDDANFPLDGLIDKRALQLFFKRLRKAISPSKIRYIACGEYGDKTRRPHYHAIIFGDDFRSDKIDINADLYTSPSLESIWGLGHVSIAPVTMSSICYVCGYVFKKISDVDTFSLMSRRPGIGHDWLARYHDDVRRLGAVVIEGRKYPVPPRYLDWQPYELQSVKEQRQLLVAQRDALEYRSGLRARELNRKAKLSQRGEKL